MSKIYAIVLAGGRGERVAGELPKQFLNIGNHPIIAWSLVKFNKIPGIDEIQVVIPKGYDKYIKKITRDYNITKPGRIIYGGATRQGSSYNALGSTEFKDNDILIFHDAARPFINEEIIASCIEKAKKHGASGVYLNAIDTIARTEGGFVRSIPPRETMYYTQTPQAFRFEIIYDAHRKAMGEDINDATDDAGLVVRAGNSVRVVEGDPANIKITTAHDLQYANQVAEWE